MPDPSLDLGEGLDQCAWRTNHLEIIGLHFTRGWSFYIVQSLRGEARLIFSTFSSNFRGFFLMNDFSVLRSVRHKIITIISNKISSKLNKR